MSTDTDTHFSTTSWDFALQGGFYVEGIESKACVTLKKIDVLRTYPVIEV